MTTTTPHQQQFKAAFRNILCRMLINQHTILFGNQVKHPRHIGAIDPSCDVVSIVNDAYENAKYLCEVSLISFTYCSQCLKKKKDVLQTL